MLAHLPGEVLQGFLGDILCLHALLKFNKCCHPPAAGIIVAIFDDILVQVQELIVLSVSDPYHHYLAGVVRQLDHQLFRFINILNLASDQDKNYIIYLASFVDFVLQLPEGRSQM